VGLVTLYAISRVHHNAAYMAFIVFVVVAIASSWVFLFAYGDVDTKTYSHEYGGFKGSGSTANDGEMEKWGRIVTAIDASKDSEPITIGGFLQDVGLTNCLLLPFAEYRLTFSEDFEFSGVQPTEKDSRTATFRVLQSWAGDPSGPFGPGEYIDLPAWTFRLRGVYAHGSTIDISLRVECAFDQPRELATDKVQLLSGWGSVSWGKDRYEVGDEACFTWSVPFIASVVDAGKGWFIEGFHKGTGEQLFPRKEIASLTGSQCISVTAEMFQSTGDCENVIVARLSSEIYTRSEDYSTVIDLSSQGPSISGFHSDRSEYLEGDTVHLTWNEEPNGGTNLPITKVTISYGEGEVKDHDVAPGTEFFDITTSEIGSSRNYHVELVIQDSGCRPASAETEVRIHAKGTFNPSPFNIPPLFWVFLIVGVMVMVALPLAPLPGSPQVRILVGILLGSLVVVAGAIIFRVIQ
jgi:hypothetical protein